MTFREFMIEKLEKDPDLTKREKKTVVSYYKKGTRKRVVSIPKLDSPRYLSDFFVALYEYADHYNPQHLHFIHRVNQLIVQFDFEVQRRRLQ